MCWFLSFNSNSFRDEKYLLPKEILYEIFLRLLACWTMIFFTQNEKKVKIQIKE